MPFLPKSLSDEAGKLDARLCLMAAGFSVLLVAFHDLEALPVVSSMNDHGNVTLYINTAVEDSQDQARKLLSKLFEYPGIVFAPPHQNRVASHTVRDACPDVWQFLIDGLYRPN